MTPGTWKMKNDVMEKRIEAQTGTSGHAEEYYQRWIEKSGRPPCLIQPVKRF